MHAAIIEFVGLKVGRIRPSVAVDSEVELSELVHNGQRIHRGIYLVSQSHAIVKHSESEGHLSAIARESNRHLAVIVGALFVFAPRLGPRFIYLDACHLKDFVSLKVLALRHKAKARLAQQGIAIDNHAVSAIARLGWQVFNDYSPIGRSDFVVSGFASAQHQAHGRSAK